MAKEPDPATARTEIGARAVERHSTGMCANIGLSRSISRPQTCYSGVQKFPETREKDMWMPDCGRALWNCVTIIVWYRRTVQE